MGELAYYASTYEEARAQFRQRATDRGGILTALSVNQQQGLFIDTALWQGSSDTLLIHVSGVHGVEAYPGSAVQCAFLDQWNPNQLGDCSLLLIHCVNPFGMRYLRRWNAHNVDLNRNFLDQFAELPANPMYSKLNDFLNPKQERQLNGFTWQALRKLLRYRFSALQQAIAQGQYSNPEGLFYGGNQLSTEASLLLEFFRQHLSHYTRIRGIDFHTGLGKFGQSSFYLEPDFSFTQHQQAESLLNTSAIYGEPGKRQSYRIQGSLIAGLKRFYHSQDFLMLTQEIGTIGPIRILQALREENYCYYHKINSQPQTAQRLKQVFCLDEPEWKETAVRAGVQSLLRLIETVG
ncbi:MAG: DUF2817 domain-containing protein [Cyclobacteriaceae bacterium]